MVLQDLYADAAVTSLDQDSLERGEYAQGVASVLKEVAEQSVTSVLAIIGPWGSGKTSALNFSCDEIQKISDDWEVLRFNPWSFSDVESLVSDFFKTLKISLPDLPGKELRNKLAQYSHTIAPYGALAKLAGLDASGIIKAMADKLDGDKSSERARSDLTEALRDCETKFVVVIDDLDRLLPGELLVVLKLIRLVGSLPNIYYLLAFDEKTIVDSLCATELANGDPVRAHDFLEKIVQVRLDLPPMTLTQQAKYFSDGISRVLKRFNAELTTLDSVRLSRSYEFYFNRRLSTPRALKRFFAQVDATLPPIAGEVNIVDFLFLTYMRVFDSRLYSLVPQLRESLLGRDQTWYNLAHWLTFSKEQKNQTWLSHLRTYGLSNEEAERFSKILTSLFPAMAAFEEMAEVGARLVNSDDELRDGRHVSSEHYFDRYFQFAVPSSDVTDQAAKLLFEELASDVQSIDLDLGEPPLTLLANHYALLPKLRSFIKAKRPANPAALVRALGGLYHEIDHEANLMSRNSRDEIHLILYALLTTEKTKQERELFYGDLLVAKNVAMVGDLAAKITSMNNRAENLTTELEYVDRVADFLGTIVEPLAGQAISEITNAQRDVFLRWTQLVKDHQKVKDFAWSAINSKAWSLEDYLGLLVTDRFFYGAKEMVRRVGELDLEWLENFAGTDLVIATLGNRLGEPEPIPRSLSGPDLPATPQNRRKVALSTVARVKLQRDEALQGDSPG